ncbi:unnamed protein product, partial [Vitis vinifera]|uniref:Uncharacterized protein n=1 Tax=Vitis vinifera TaxID=29760 RepID=D7TY22_VITVI
MPLPYRSNNPTLIFSSVSIGQMHP